MGAADDLRQPDGPVPSGTVGQNVRDAREQAGLSVREFARRLGVTASFLSQFELGQSQASVSTLFAIATQLNLSIDELLGNRVAPPRAADDGAGAALPDTAVPDTAVPDTAVPDTAVRDSAEADGEEPDIEEPDRYEDEFVAFQTGVRWRRLTRRRTEGIDFLLTEYEPGADSAARDQPQRHPGTDYGYILEGTLTVIVGGRRRRVGQDQAVSLRGEVPHRLINETDELVRAIWFVSR